MSNFGWSPSRTRFESTHRVFPGGFNPTMRESHPQQQRGPTYILNGERAYSHEAAIARGKTMGSMTVQFVPKSGLAQEAVSCDNLVALAAALPTDFAGGYVTMRGNRVHERVPAVRRDVSTRRQTAYLRPSELDW